MAKEWPRAGESHGAAPGSRRNSTWHAVSILASESSCCAARALRSLRFLSSDAPRLPLAECECVGSCPCAYKHHADRRSQARRLDELTGLRRAHRVEVERRTRRGRRTTDF
jgi:hypothetical protein